MSTTVQLAPTPGLTSPVTSARLVPAMVNGQRIYIECPAICVTDHVAESVRHLDDVLHFGQAEELSAPEALIWPSMERPHSFLSVRIGLDPNSSNPALSRPHLIVDDEREMLYMDARQAEDFADDLILFAMQVRAMARTAAEHEQTKPPLPSRPRSPHPHAALTLAR